LQISSIELFVEDHIFADTDGADPGNVHDDNQVL
jgi:hypothetical protein